MKFDLPKDHSSIIKVIGVGGGGSNAVNHMYQRGIQGVDFMICNTDSQSLDKSPVPVKLQLGASLTEGRGAGSIPDVGKNAAIESIDDVKEILEKNTTMVFITAGMGGGTGTGAAPVIAQAAREMGILTVGIVTIPFNFEGRKRRDQAARGLEQMRNAVDTLLVIQNDKLREVYGNLSLKEAFAKADDVLTTAAKGIAEVVSITGEINVDMNDVQTVMKNSGVAIMGSGLAEGEGRALKAVECALESPLLNDNDISGAQFVLLNITYGNQEIMMDEISTITDYIQEAAGSTADVIWGYAIDEELGDKISVTVIATGFNANSDINNPNREEVKQYRDLEEDIKPVGKKISNPFETSNAPNPVQEEEQEAEPFLVSKPVEEKTEQQPAPQEQPIASKPEEEVNARAEQPATEEEPQAMRFSAFGSKPELRSNEQNTMQTPRQEEPAPQKKTYILLDEDEDETEDNNTHQVEANKQFKQEQEEVVENNYNAPVNRAHKEENKDDAQPQIDLFSGDRKTMAIETEKIEKRIAKIKDMSDRMRTPGGLAELEKEPAYVRANFKFKNVESEDDESSRLSLDKDNYLNSDNSFLHDNVD
ncbi:cell division protein FtsZ [Luteibaculum oceani]|uniref:Cell division protein FtsZ n=1 Tax=Luteibaculum oceani TaxID=1294296 RepID=A0A5C6V232_9FLAO|nr:cell division protein FtsZ [Luteibaculum oceani]TXC78870.1 cell division protein FtsZ [Luteibaculum oceani]